MRNKNYNLIPDRMIYDKLTTNYNYNIICFDIKCIIDKSHFNVINNNSLFINVFNRFFYEKYRSQEVEHKLTNSLISRKFITCNNMKMTQIRTIINNLDEYKKYVEFYD